MYRRPAKCVTTSVAATCGRGVASALLVIGALFLFASPAHAQFAPQPPARLSTAVQLDEVDSSTQAHLERVDAFLADRQWDEAIETLRRIMEDFGDKMIRTRGSQDDRDAVFPRYLSLRDYCQLRLVRLHWEAPEALALYRRRVDPVAEQTYRKGIKTRDEMQLRAVVDRMLASSYGDDALYALGEISLQRGDYSAARFYWERIGPQLRAPRRELDVANSEGAPATGEGRPLWLAHKRQSKPDLAPLLARHQGPPTWLVYPDADVNLADVRARLVLVSILEGSPKRARFELEVLDRTHPDAQGRLSGLTVAYGSALAALLKKSENWPAAVRSPDWSTFAGSPDRTKVVAESLDVGGDVKVIELGGPFSAEDARSPDAGFLPHRVAEDAGALLSYHPLVVGDLIVIADRKRDRENGSFVPVIRVFDLHTGEPAWAGAEETFEGKRLFTSAGSRRRLGVPRFTLTAFGQTLFARVGSQLTGWPADESGPHENGYLVALDLTAQGRQLPEFHNPLDHPRFARDRNWVFEGSPLTDGANLFVAMRRNDVRPQAHVACFDARTGALRWRRFVCSAETPGQGQAEELTHNLLTLHQGTIYFNTNLGAVAALRAEDGAVKWIALYPRADVDRADPQNETLHFQRDLNPCVFHKGLLFVAPSDCDHVFALCGATGQMIWQAWPTDAIHLLGVGGEHLIASGNRLWWLDVYTGETLAKFPEHDRPDPRGFGRGVLAGKFIYYPTREKIHVFHQTPADGQPQWARQPIDLAKWDAGVSGGNLVVSGEYLIIAAAEKLFIVGPSSQ